MLLVFMKLNFQILNCAYIITSIVFFMPDSVRKFYKVNLPKQNAPTCVLASAAFDWKVPTKFPFL